MFNRKINVQTTLSSQTLKLFKDAGLNENYKFNILEIWICSYRQFYNFTLDYFQKYVEEDPQNSLANLLKSFYDKPALIDYKIKDFLSHLEGSQDFQIPPLEVLRSSFLDVCEQLLVSLKNIREGREKSLKFFYRNYKRPSDFHIRPTYWDITEYEDDSEEPIFKTKYIDRLPQEIPCSKIFMGLTNALTGEEETYSFYLEGSLDNHFNNESVPLIRVSHNYDLKQISLLFPIKRI